MPIIFFFFMFALLIGIIYISQWKWHFKIKNHIIALLIATGIYFILNYFFPVFFKYHGYDFEKAFSEETKRFIKVGNLILSLFIGIWFSHPLSEAKKEYKNIFKK